MIRLLSIFCVLALLPVNAYAKIDDEGVKTVKNMVQGLLDYQKNTGDALGTLEVVYNGEIKVEQMADYYAVTLPHIILKGKNDISVSTPDFEKMPQFTVDLGTVTMNLAPDDKDGYWKSSIQIADSIVLKEDDVEQFSIKMGGQNIIAILSEQLGYFTKLNMNLTDITFDGTEKNQGITLGGIQVYYNFDGNDEGKFSGPYAVTLKNVHLSPPYGDEYMVAEELKAHGDLDSVYFPSLKEYEERVLNFYNAFNSVEENSENPEDVIGNKDVVDSILALYDFDWNGLSGAYSLKNFKFSSKDDLESMSIGSATLGMAMSGLKSDEGGIQFDFAYDALEMKGDKYKDAQAYAPQKFAFNVKLDQVPYSSLSEMAQTSINSIVANPEAAEMVGMGLMLRVPSLLTQSGTKAVVKGEGVKDGLYNVMMDGTAAADLKAIMGFTANFKTVFEGLDAVLSKLKAEEDKPELANVIEDMEHFKEIGVQEVGLNGQPAYSYTFEVTPEGEMLLNGKDAATAMPE